MRARWKRSFGVLGLTLVIGGLSAISGTQYLIGSARGTAQRLEFESGQLALLRADIVPYAVLAASATASTRDAAGRQEAAQLKASVDARFAHDVARFHAAGTRQLLAQADAAWVTFGDELNGVDTTLPAAQQAAARGTVVGAAVPKLMDLLDRTGAASRAAAHHDLARHAVFEQVGLAWRIVMFLLGLFVMVRLARRLAAEVLEPVSLLRESANQVAAGDLAHRVQVVRADEIGDLAMSFNAMAEAIADSHQSLTQQANHDSLTGLPNRANFRARVIASLCRPEQRAGTQAVLFVDLDDFKDVNDVLGHPAGDELLRAVAARMTDVLRPGDMLARLGGDEFAVLLEGISDDAAASQLAQRVVAALAAPQVIQGQHVQVGASIGIAMRHAGSDLASLMHEADVAMYSAKAHGKNRVELFGASPESRDRPSPGHVSVSSR